ncbi:MAG: hypothetical protein ACI9EK_001781 [Psychroserpens sp.]|jgi:hypothetical protein
MRNMIILRPLSRHYFEFVYQPNSPEHFKQYAFIRSPATSTHN